MRSRPKKLIVSLPDGTKNVLSDASAYRYETEDTSEPDAALFSKDDLTINGGGTLTVNANYDNGIKSKDDLRVIGATLDVTAINNAIVGRDGVAVKYGSFTLTSGADGIKANNDTDTDKGLIEIEDGIFRITAAQDGIKQKPHFLSLAVNLRSRRAAAPRARLHGRIPLWAASAAGAVWGYQTVKHRPNCRRRDSRRIVFLTSRILLPLI